MTARNDDSPLWFLIIGTLLVGAVLLFFATGAWGHDSWIMRGGHRNAAGEWCCGESDCFPVATHTAYKRARSGALEFGYLVEGPGEPDTWEFVPDHERKDSPDGLWWRCKRPDGTRRCFFGPPPAT